MKLKLNTPYEITFLDHTQYSGSEKAKPTECKVYGVVSSYSGAYVVLVSWQSEDFEACDSYAILTNTIVKARRLK